MINITSANNSTLNSSNNTYTTITKQERKQPIVRSRQVVSKILCMDNMKVDHRLFLICGRLCGILHYQYNSNNNNNKYEIR
jgi:hypothetical protein